MNISSILPLSAKNVSLSRDGRLVLQQINLDILPSKRTIILGPNGAGKTTLLRLLHGLVVPDTGEVLWLGSHAGMQSRRQAMVFQRPVMLRRSVYSNVMYGLKFSGLRRSQREARTAEVLRETGLESLAKRSARKLSVGEQQRVAIARAWALGPEVLFLDEPTASLDPGATKAIERLVDFISNAGTTIVLTTQDLAQARRLAERVIFIYNGQVVEAADADSFFLSPQSPEARAFLSGELLWPGAAGMKGPRLCVG